MKKCLASGEFHVNTNTKKEKYPHRTSRFYLSTLTAVLSIALALLLLQDPILLLYYFASTLLITAITVILRIRLFSIGTPKQPENDLSQTEESHSTFGTLIIMFSVLLAFLLLPLLLVRVLDPYSWFILMISLTSGLSLAEILFYFHTQRDVGQKYRGD